MLSGVFADGWLGKAGVNMSDLLPQMLGRPAHGVLIRGIFGDVISVVAPQSSQNSSSSHSLLSTTIG